MELFSRIQELRDKDDKEDQTKARDAIAEDANSDFKTLKEAIVKFKTNKGGMNEKQIWNLKKKLCPKSKDPPTAMLDKKGTLLTDNKAIERRAVKVYKQGLAGNKIVDNLVELEKDTKKLCKNRLKLSKENKSEPWEMSDLHEVLKHLGREKSRDGSGYSNEIFMISAAGEDLQLAVPKLLNKIKEQQCFPEALSTCNITSLHKKKARNNLKPMPMWVPGSTEAAATISLCSVQ